MGRVAGTTALSSHPTEPSSRLHHRPSAAFKTRVFIQYKAHPECVRPTKLTVNADCAVLIAVLWCLLKTLPCSHRSSLSRGHVKATTKLVVRTLPW